MFLDEVRIRVRSGAGGPGSVSFRREKYVPKGGPDGGDGGRGGDIFLVGSQGLNSLSHFRGHRVISSERGGPGARSLRHGADADPVRVLVPVGTIAYLDDGQEVLGEITADGDELQVARGGRGGRGNSHFADSRQRAPKFAELGEPGEERDLRLELQLIADIGLVGAPNAGKSTLLGALTEATPKVAGYAFTTLEPNLGVLEMPDGARLTLADIPGLIEGASEGAGLGSTFLKHLTRTGLLIHVVDAAQPVAESLAEWRAVTDELRSYQAELPGRVRLVALNKMDIPGAGATARALARQLGSGQVACYQISAREGTGLEELLGGLARAVEEAAQPARPVLRVYRPEPVAGRITIQRRGDAYHVTSRKITGIVARTDLANPDALVYMRQQLAATGLRQALADAGANAGDTVVVGEAEFLFDPEL